MKEDAIVLLASDVAREKFLMVEQGKTPIAKNLTATRERIFSNLQGIGKSGNLETIIAAEKTLVQFDLKEHANSTAMKSSLNASLDELAAIETHIGLVGDPKKYQHVDASYAREKFRDKNDLPVDGARHSFRSQNTRLENYDKAKSGDNEKAIVHARRQNIKIAEKLYIERQEKALGRESVEQQKEPPEAQRKTLTKEEYGIALNLFLDQKKKEPGMSPQKLAGIRAGIEKAIDEKVKNPAEKSPAARKSKVKDEPDLER